MLSPRPVVFGEVLFDEFPDGRRALGGAPFNVAWHLEGFGLRPRFVSRVGRDSEGGQVLETMRSWGMSTAGVQLDDSHPTGRVRVRIDAGEPSFQIGTDQAYDYIDPEQVPVVDRSGSRTLLYHGTLGIRGETSRRALERLGMPPGGAVCDLNLRKPWWTRERVEWCIRRASWLKLSAGELAELTGLPSGSEEECLAAAEHLVRESRLPNLVVTRGPDGALGLFEGAGPVRQEGVPPPQMVDTVGAGDAFCAVMILGILEEWEPPRILRQAVRFAAEVCGQPGATSPDRAMYTMLDEREP